MAGDEHEVRVEISPKRVRAYCHGKVVFDTTEARLVWEIPYYPQYYVPRQDVIAELAPSGRTKTSRKRGVGKLYAVRVDGATVDDAAIIFDESPVPELRDLVRFKWDAMDSWFEEDEEVFTHPRSPYTRVDIQPTSRQVVVEAGGEVIAKSSRSWVLFETGQPPRYFLPKVDVRLDLLIPSEFVTSCPHKGTARYWSVRTADEDLDNAVLSYPRPLPESARVAGLIGFDTSKVDVLVDGVQLPAG